MKNLILPALLAAAVVLTGCAPSTTIVAPEKPTVTPAPTPTPTKTTNDRGNIIKTVGQTFWLTKDKSSTDAVATFVVNAITVDPQCTGPAAKSPENGHLVRVDISAESTPEMQGTFFLGNWKAITDAGTTVNGHLDTLAAWSCIDDSERLPSTIGPGEKLTGAVMLDVPTPHGSIILPVNGPSTGWEWAY